MSMTMIEPAPEVGAAVASAATPCAVPDAASTTDASIGSATAAPAVAPATAASAVNASLVDAPPADGAGASAPAAARSAAALRSAGRVAFEAPAAVIVGPAEKDWCQLLCPCFEERTFVSYGEAHRHVVVANGSVYVFVDGTDPAPLYAVPLRDLAPTAEDPDRPDKYSHTISPEVNTGFRSPTFAARSKASLETVLLKDTRGRIAYQFTFHKDDAGKDASDKFVAAVVSTRT